MASIVKYVFEDGTSTTSYEEAKASGKAYKVTYEAIKEERKLTPEQEASRQKRWEKATAHFTS